MTPRARKPSSRYEATRNPDIDRDKRSGKFYFRGTVAGEWIDRSLKTDKFGIAETRAKSLIAQIQGAPESAGMRVRVRKSFDDAFDLALAIQSAQSKATYDQISHIIEKHLRPWFKVHCRTLAHFENDSELKWAEYRVFQNEKTPGRKLGHDRRFLLFTLQRAFLKGWTKKVFKKSDFPLLEAVEPIGRALEDQEVTKILSYLKQHHEKTYLQVLMGVTMGMRISEILHLRKAEVDLFRKEINLDAGRLKTRRRRQVNIPISDAVFPILKRYVLASEGTYVFPQTRTVGWDDQGRRLYESDWEKPQDDNRYHWERAQEATRVSCRFHDLRHTAISNAADAGMPELMAEKIFGATPETIRRVYLHVKQDAQIQFRSMFNQKFKDRSDTQAGTWKERGKQKK